MGYVGMKKVLYISGTRADYGLMESVLKHIDQHSNLKLEIIATGMHLMEEFGYTIAEIKKSFTVHSINAIYENDDKESTVNFIGKFILLINKKIKDIKPDIILLLGDRAEMLAGAIIGAYLTIPVVHLHGGDVTSTVDELSRHAITKLAHIHLVATEKSRERIIRMGEEPWRIYVVGAPGLDKIVNHRLIPKKELFNELNLDPFKITLLVIQHPVTTETENADEQMVETMEAIKQLGYQTIVIYPNADAGGRKIIQVIEKYRTLPFVRIYKNLNRLTYLSLMSYVNVMIGNSSSGIIEAPSFGLPVVNIGTRQEGRERGKNVIDVEYNKSKIIKAINKALNDKEFLAEVKKCENPYGDGKAGPRVAEILSRIEITPQLLQKKITY